LGHGVASFGLELAVVPAPPADSVVGIAGAMLASVDGEGEGEEGREVTVPRAVKADVAAEAPAGGAAADVIGDAGGLADELGRLHEILLAGRTRGATCIEPP